MKPPIDWLLAGEPWIQYRTRLDLLGETEADARVRAVRKAMLDDPPVRNLIGRLTGWPGTVISSHKSAGQPFHQLTFAADLGFNAGDPGIESITARILSHPSSEGPFQLPMNVTVQHGGSGTDQWAWALCDAPLILYALVKFGLKTEPAVKAAASHLVGLIRDNGWPCAVSKELGKFRGPGRKEDPCPYANLVMLKALAEMEAGRESRACQIGANTLLELWSASDLKHPYMFFMGTDFRKLKVPFVWYDLLHVLEVLSRFPWLRNDPRLHEMLTILLAKADSDGRYTLESVWTYWHEWEFGQKKLPSRWLTLLAWRIIERLN